MFCYVLCHDLFSDLFDWMSN